MADRGVAGQPTAYSASQSVSQGCLSLNALFGLPFSVHFSFAIRVESHGAESDLKTQQQTGRVSHLISESFLNPPRLESDLSLRQGWTIMTIDRSKKVSPLRPRVRKHCSHRFKWEINWNSSQLWAIPTITRLGNRTIYWYILLQWFQHRNPKFIGDRLSLLRHPPGICNFYWWHWDWRVVFLAQCSGFRRCLGRLASALKYHWSAISGFESKRPPNDRSLSDRTSYRGDQTIPLWFIQLNPSPGLDSKAKMKVNPHWTPMNKKKCLI